MKIWSWRLKKPLAETVRLPERNSSIADLLDRPDLSRDGFFLLYAKMIEVKFEAQNLRFEEADVLHYELTSGMKMTAFMQNAWLQCEQGDEPRSVILDRYLAALEISVSPTPATRDQVVAIIKDANYVSFLQNGKTAPPLHLAGDLWVVYAVDLPEATQGLRLEIMDALALQVPDLHSLALRNLRQLLPKVEYIGDGPWFMVSAGPDYSASLLLLDEVWDEMAERVDGDVVAVAPSRDIVLCTGSKSQDGLQAIRRHARQAVENGHHVISSTLLRRTEGRWVNFD